MKTLFLAWQDRRPQSRAWHTIGWLQAEAFASSNRLYRFGYTQGAMNAQRDAGLKPLESFPNFKSVYESHELFPLFQNRLPSSTRKDFNEYLCQLDLKPDEVDPIEILSITGGERKTDNLEVFPKIERSASGMFRCKFFLHGWNHVSKPAQEKIDTLKSGDSLSVAIELNNPATGSAIQLQVRETTIHDNYHIIGWAPRYLVKDLLQAIAEHSQDIRAKVVKNNPPPVPFKQKILVELEGHWPQKYEPMSSKEFRPITTGKHWKLF
ncbi:MAG: hypothetical protein ACOY3I_05880 [Verrucomicrobiota bacterium]